MIEVLCTCINRKRKYKPNVYPVVCDDSVSLDYHDDFDTCLVNFLKRYLSNYYDDFFYRKVYYCEYRKFNNPVFHLFFFDSETGEDLGSYYFEVKGVK